MQETVGSRIKALELQQALRTGRAPLNATDLAAALGVSYESLRKWTAGKTAPNRARAETIAAYLGCPVESFMLGVRFSDEDDQSETAPPASDEKALLAVFRALPQNSPARARILAYAQGAADAELGGAQPDSGNDSHDHQAAA